MSANRLAAVLRVRRLQERQARAAFGRSQAALHASRLAEAAAREELADRGRAGVGTVAGIALVAERTVVTSGLLALDTRVASTRSASTAADRSRAAWTDAARRVDALERVDARLRAAAAAEADRRERAEIDELVIARHLRGDR